MNKTIIERLNWRYATKQFDSAKKVSDANFNTIMEAARLAPSSYGLQPWKFIVVKDELVRQELRKHAWGQSQVTDASHFVVFAAQKGMAENDVERFVKSIAQERGVERASLEGYKQMMVGSTKGKSVDELTVWNTNQLYLSLGEAISVAAMLNVDTCPMEGFDPKKFDEVLNLAKQHVTAKVCLAIGYRSKEDKHASLKKVRYPIKEVVVEI